MCFGIPSVFSFSATACSQCGEFDTCRAESLAALKGAEPIPVVRMAIVDHERFMLVGKPGVMPDTKLKPCATARPQGRVSRAKHRDFDLTAAQRTTVASVPGRVGDFLTKLFKRGHDVEIHVALRDGVEPLEGVVGYRSLKVALKGLDKGFDRQTLRTYYMDELGWSYSSAWNEVSLMWSALPAIGVALEKHGRLVVAPRVKTQNN